MGLYNYHLESLPHPLNNKCCFVCNNQMTPYNQNPELDGFQYKCSNCNPNVVIELSGSLLASSLYSKLCDNNNVLKIIKKQIEDTTNERFQLSTSFVSKYIH